MIKVGFICEIESDPMCIVSIEDSILEALIVIKEIRIDSLKAFESQYDFKSEDIIKIAKEYSY